jgi:hypothetical protein
MDLACSKHGEDETSTGMKKIYLEHIAKRKYLEDLSTDGKNTLKRILRR